MERHNSMSAVIVLWQFRRNQIKTSNKTYNCFKPGEEKKKLEESTHLAAAVLCTQCMLSERGVVHYCELASQ